MEMTRMQKLLIALALSVALFFGLLYFGFKKSDSSLLPSFSFNQGKEIYGPYRIVHIRDGDTLDADIDGTETTLRFIGVDTPESVNPDESLNCEEGRIASQFTKDYLAEQESVWIEYDKQHNDDYGRTLAYIYLDSEGKTMYQDILLENGMARCLRIEPNTKYSWHFSELEAKAKLAGTGFWEYDFWND